MFNSGHFGSGGKAAKFEKTFLADYEYVLQKNLLYELATFYCLGTVHYYKT